MHSRRKLDESCAPLLPHSPVRVVVIDSDPIARERVAAWLRATPAIVIAGVVADAEAALGHFASAAPDVALVAIELAGLSGIECVRRLKREYPRTQFVMLTAYDDQTHIFRALAAGATGYLQKGIERNALVAALRAAAEGGSPLSPGIARKVVGSFQGNPVECAGSVHLTPREEQILALLAEGYLYKDIASIIGIGLATVSTHIRRLYEKLQVNSRAQAVALYRPNRGS